MEQISKVVKHVAGVAIATEQCIDQLRTLLWIIAANESLPLCQRRDAARDVEIQSTHEHVLRNRRIGLEFLLLPICGLKAVILSRFRQSSRLSSTGGEGEKRERFHGTRLLKTFSTTSQKDALHSIF